MSYNQSIIYDTEDEDDEKDDFFDYLVHWCQSIPKNIRRQLTGTWEMEQWIRAQNHLARMLKIKDATHRKTRTTGTRTTCSFFVSRSNRTNSPHGINNNHPDGHHNNLPLNTMDCSSCLSVSCCLENPHIWLCIAEFLTATNLVHLSHLSRTNSFFRNLVHQHAAATLYRTQTITTTSADTRIQPPPSSILEHVRAMEIIQGNLEYDDDQHENGSVAIDNHADEDSHRHHRHGIQRPKNMVPIRITLPMQKIIVTNAGDTEYNGIYCCTSFDGNGYVFTKPRRSTLRQQQRRNLLWYMSKEVWTDQEHIQGQGGIHRDDGTTEVFSFWSMLMVEPNHTTHPNATTTTTSWTDYPSSSFPTQTSRSQMITGGWHNLPTTAQFHPPTVELWEDETL